MFYQGKSQSSDKSPSVLVHNVDKRNLAKVGDMWKIDQLVLKLVLKDNEHVEIQRRMPQEDSDGCFDQFRLGDAKRERFEVSLEWKK